MHLQALQMRVTRELKRHLEDTPSLVTSVGNKIGAGVGGQRRGCGEQVERKILKEWRKPNLMHSFIQPADVLVSVASGMNVADCQHSRGVINDDLTCVKWMHI